MNRFFAYISALIVTSMPAMAWAETAPEHALEGAIEGAVHEGEHGGSGGLPQFNPDSWPSQAFWLVISFGAFYFFFSRIILPSMAGTINARTSKIEGDIRAAEELSARAQEIKESYESGLLQAASKATSDLKDIDEAAKAKLASALADFRTRYESEVAKVEANLDQSKNAAMNDVQKIAADLAAQAAQKIAGIPANSADAESVVKSLKNKAA